VYLTDAGAVVEPSTPLISAISEVPAFDREAVIVALQADQSGQTTFPEFLTAVWSTGVTGYVVDLEQRTVTYRGIDNATYVERYPAVEI
jgi:uncharacterized protein YbcV (DUF1398 family)